MLLALKTLSIPGWKNFDHLKGKNVSDFFFIAIITVLLKQCKC